MGLKLIVAGSRKATDYKGIASILDSLLPPRGSLPIPEAVLCGCANGADLCGEKWAKSRGINVEYFPAKWDEHGKAAGPIRNNEMAHNANALVVFWDGKSRGSADMIGRFRSVALSDGREPLIFVIKIGDNGEVIRDLDDEFNKAVFVAASKYMNDVVVDMNVINVEM